MRSLLPPNSMPLERTLEAVTLRLTDVRVPLRTLWNATTISAELLPWLAWSVGLDSWKTYWPVSVKRARTAQAIDIARRKGTAKAVRDVAAAFGAFVTIVEWWQKTPRGIPHTFDVIVTVSGQGGTEASAAYVEDIIAEITRTKPARSHFVVTQGLHVLSGIGLVRAVRAQSYAHMTFEDVA